MITKAPGMTIAEARLWQKATAPHAEAMRRIREAIEELFGPIAEMDPAETFGSDPARGAEEIVAVLQRVAAYLAPAQRRHGKSVNACLAD